MSKKLYRVLRPAFIDGHMMEGGALVELDSDNVSDQDVHLEVYHDPVKNPNDVAKVAEMATTEEGVKSISEKPMLPPTSTRSSPPKPIL